MNTLYLRESRSPALHHVKPGGVTSRTQPSKGRVLIFFGPGTEGKEYELSRIASAGIRSSLPMAATF
jgi:hypothetical protein